MITQLGATNPINMLNATNAFKAVQKPLKEIMPTMDNTSDGIKLNDSNNILKAQNISEIKEFAKIAGEDNISLDDIKYGVTYGRSVIANFMV